MRPSLFFTLVLSLSSFFQVSAQEAVDSLPKALLWQIDAPGAPAPSYLFGTIHLIDAENFLISDSLMSVLNRSESVVFEIDPQDMQDPMMAMQLMMKAFMKGDTSLRDLLTTDEYAKVNQHFSEKLGLPMMMLDRVKPMFLSMLAEIDPSEIGGMFGGEGDEESSMKSYEFELDAIARAAEKKVSGLESVDFQLGLFDSIPYRVQAKMLLQAVENPDGSQEDQLAALVATYTSGDIDKMYFMSVGEDGGFTGFERMLLTNRNRNWIKPITEQIQQGSVLYAVGAGHLGGPEGVVRLLRAKGLTLTPLSVR